MTDLTPLLNTFLTEKHSTKSIPPPGSRSVTTTPDEFLKEAYRINSHISSLLHYLQSIRHSYVTTTPTPPPSQRQHNNNPRRTKSSTLSPSSSTSSTPTTLEPQGQTQKQGQPLTDPQRDAIDSSTALLLRDLSTSIANLASAESLRQETQNTLLRKKYGSKNGFLWRWAAGNSAGSGGAAGTGTGGNRNANEQQTKDEETAQNTKIFREAVLWFLRRCLERVTAVQAGMVERRIERVREREKSVLYKNSAAAARGGPSTMTPGTPALSTPIEGPSGGFGAEFDAAAISQAEVAAIEAQLSPQQLQLFAEENDAMMRGYEDTLNKVQNAEKSLLEIASLQQTLVSHLSTQEEYITQLVTDAGNTTTNIGEGNKELKRATEARSTAQLVFWGTVGLCSWLVIWDLIF